MKSRSYSHDGDTFCCDKCKEMKSVYGSLEQVGIFWICEDCMTILVDRINAAQSEIALSFIQPDRLSEKASKDEATVKTQQQCCEDRPKRYPGANWPINIPGECIRVGLGF